jgi:hypothetical protein
MPWTEALCGACGRSGAHRASTGRDAPSRRCGHHSARHSGARQGRQSVRAVRAARRVPQGMQRVCQRGFANTVALRRFADGCVPPGHRRLASLRAGPSCTGDVLGWRSSDSPDGVAHVCIYIGAQDCMFIGRAKPGSRPRKRTGGYGRQELFKSSAY